jgi:hypothetical protein
MRKLIAICKCGAEIRHEGAKTCRGCYNAAIIKHSDTRRARVRAAGYKYKATAKGRFKSLKEIAAKRGIEVALSPEAYAAIIANNTCIYCGGVLPKYGHGLDRKNNALGYTQENVVPCCSSCNSIKSDRIYFEEMLWIMARRKHLGIL